MAKYPRTILIGILLCLSAACSLGENQAITSSPVTLNNQPFINTPKKPYRTTGHFSYLSIAIPKEYRLDQDTWCVRKQDGTKIKIDARLVTKEGKVHDFQRVGFGFGKGKQYLNLSSDQKYDPDVAYTQVSITSSEPITVDEVQWWSIDK